MLRYLKANAVVVAISISFFIPMFMVASEMYELTDREMVVALVASLVCGATILVASMASARVSPFIFSRLDVAK